MKKPYFAALLALSICLCGCGSKGASLPIRAEEEIYETETSEVVMEEAPSALINVSGISITELTESSSFYASEDDSVCVLDATAAYPMITIADRADASNKINNAISTELETFWNFEKENVSYAEEEYRMTLDDPEYGFHPYTAQFSYEIKRCDDKIISIVFTQYDYTGGAHGNSWNYGVTFDTATGDRLHLEALSDDSTAFYQMLFLNLNAQAALPAYETYIFDEFVADIDASLLKDSAVWYFDRSGLSFISNPYVLGPYAAGTFEFNIPYADLNGLNEKYSYDGVFIRKLFPGISVQYDINGDGTTDEVCYSITSDEDYSNPQTTLTIDGHDYSKQLDKLHLTYPWTGAYYLMDVDSEDGYIEVAICNENFNNPEGTCTHFFRYSTTNQLVYQGNTPGVFNENMQIRYNANGNLIVCDRNGDPVE